MQSTPLSLILGAGIVVKTVLFMLICFSVGSWAIIIYKHRQLSRASKETEAFLIRYASGAGAAELMELAETHSLSPVSGIYRALYADSVRPEAPDLNIALKRYVSAEAARLEGYLGFLATTGSTTPFIGLFGTVWGIMNSFRGMGAAGAASLAVVAPGIAEALIATAMGLAAAIPAVIAYNYFLEKTRRTVTEMEDIAEEFPGRLAREAARAQAGL